jgi:Family of unknown function (DUF6600)
MTERASIRRRAGAHVRALLLATAFLSPAPFIMPGVVTPVQAQVAVRAAYGQWERHSRWGDVWRPTHVSRSWRPYTVGRWAYTNDWGWYWVSDAAEDAWGWVVYHYGRWVFDDDWGWVWIPGDQWGPAWVSWRQGDRYIGWEPLPPEEVVVDYSNRPDYWIFCRANDFIAPDIATVAVPYREYDGFFRDTVIVNRTYEFRNYGYAVDTGIAPGVIAAFVGRPVRTYDVRPLVLAGTARIPGAVEVRHEWLREGRRDEFLRQASLHETSRTITPTNRIPPPQALRPGERGRLGENPPRAAHGTAALERPPQIQGRGATPEEQRQGRQPQGNQFGREQGKQFGREQGNQPGRDQQLKQFGNERGKQFGMEEGKQQPNVRQPQGTIGRGATPEEQRQGRGPRGNELGARGNEQPGARQPQGPERRGNLNEQRPQGRGPQGLSEEQRRGPGERQSLGNEQRGNNINNPGRRGGEPRGPTRGTEGRGAIERGPQGRGIEQRPGGGTEGRGGELRRENQPSPGGAIDRRGPGAGAAERRGPETGTVGRGGGPQGGFERRGGGAEMRGGSPGGGARVEGGGGPRGGGPGGGGPRRGERP